MVFPEWEPWGSAHVFGGHRDTVLIHLGPLFVAWRAFDRAARLLCLFLCLLSHLLRHLVALSVIVILVHEVLKLRGIETR